MVITIVIAIIKILNKEYIGNAYNEFLKYISTGDFIVISSQDIPNREEIIEKILNKKGKINFKNKEDYTSFLK